MQFDLRFTFFLKHEAKKSIKLEKNPKLGVLYSRSLLHNTKRLQSIGVAEG